MDYRQLRVVWIIVLLAFTFQPASRAQNQAKTFEDVSVQRLQRDLEYLCSPTFMGRDTPGLYGDLVAMWLRDRFDSLELTPAFENESYLQEVELVTGFPDTSQTRLVIEKGDKKLELTWGKDFYTFPRTLGNQSGEYEITYNHFGMSAPELGKDDYQNSPAGNASLIWDGTGDIPAHLAGRHAMTPFKAAAARKNGAQMLLVLVRTDNDLVWQNREISRKLSDFHKPITDLNSTGDEFLTIYINANSLLEGEKIAPDDTDAMSVFKSVKLQIEYRGIEKHLSYNVAAMIGGETDEYIVLGAHYDHIGTEVSGDSLLIYPGANDNGTGVAAVLEVARLSRQSNNLSNGIIFALFTSEEDGLLGSRYFMENPPVPAGSIKAMVNLDMIGSDGYASMHQARVGEQPPDPRYAAAFHSAASPRLNTILTSLHTPDINLDVIPSGKLPFNDGGSFHDMGIPTVHFFSGFDANYSSIIDTPDKINWEKFSRIVYTSYLLTFKLRDDTEGIDFDPNLKPARSGMKY